MNRFLVKPLHGKPFLTKFYDPESHHEEGMIVFDIEGWTYSEGQDKWKDIEEDNL